jgi:hypothetical protein
MVRGTGRFPNVVKVSVLQYNACKYCRVTWFLSFGNVHALDIFSTFVATILDYSFIIFEMIFGLLLFATVLGHISNIVANISAARKDFQGK